MGQWHCAEEYDGEVREITFRSLCNSPMCPPDTAMTEWQHLLMFPEKTSLVSTSFFFFFFLFITFLFLFQVIKLTSHL